MGNLEVIVKVKAIKCSEGGGLCIRLVKELKSYTDEYIFHYLYIRMQHICTFDTSSLVAPWTPADIQLVHLSDTNSPNAHKWPLFFPYILTYILTKNAPSLFIFTNPDWKKDMRWNKVMEVKQGHRLMHTWVLISLVICHANDWKWEIFA